MKTIKAASSVIVTACTTIEGVCNIADILVQSGEVYANELLLDAKEDARLNAIERDRVYKHALAAAKSSKS